MADKTINSRAFRTEFIRLTEPTAVTALGRVIGVWHPVSVAIDSRALAGIRPGEPWMSPPPFEVFNPPASRPAAPVTPAADVPPKDVESNGASEVRTQEQRTEALEGLTRSAVEQASEGGTLTAGGSLDPAPQPTRRSRQAARDKILKAVNRNGTP